MRRGGEKMKSSSGRERKQFAEIFLLIIGALLSAACQPNAAILNSAQKDVPAVRANSAAPPLSSFDRDLETMRTANFDFIYVYRRKDGGVFDGADKQFIKENSPYETNRRILTDGDKAVIAGSNTKFMPEQIKILEQRFNVEDFSKPSVAPPANVAANANS